MKHLKFIGVLSTLIVAAFAVLNLGQSLAATTATNTTLGITPGNLTFYKDIGTDMDSYFSHSGNTNADIDIGTYGASLSPIAAQSSGDHRFTVSDLKGNAFVVTIQSSDLTAVDQSGAQLVIAKNLIGFTGTSRLGTGKAVTSNMDEANIGTSPLTFVQRADNSGTSKYSKEITLKVAVPAAQAPGSYTGLLTFTY